MFSLIDQTSRTCILLQNGHFNIEVSLSDESEENVYVNLLRVLGNSANGVAC